MGRNRIQPLIDEQPQKSGTTSSMRFQLILLTWLFALLVYPLALTLVVLADTLLGDAEFARQLLMGPKRQLVAQLLADWFAALLVVVPLWFVVRALSRLGWSTPVAAICLGLGLVLSLLAFVPPYVPLIFGALLIWAGGLNALFEYRYRRTRT